MRIGLPRTLAELTLTAHLPGTIDEVGMLGLLEDRVLKLESGLNHRVVDGCDRLPQHIARGLALRRRSLSSRRSPSAPASGS